jgi:hypothetical protein
MIRRCWTHRAEPEGVPDGVEVLYPLAAIWGIGDDVDHSMAVEQADLAQLHQLVSAVESVDERVLYGWLTGSDATSPTPLHEYLAITNLTMAAAEVRVRISQS